MVPRTVDDSQVVAIPGWFWRADIACFRFFLDAQKAEGHGGDLAELGVYQGASAVLIGSYLEEPDVFTVVDLFEEGAADSANALEVEHTYPGLSQQMFEDNYRRVHGDLPVIIRGPSTLIREHAAPKNHRFVHIDASHLYEHVVADVDTARQLLQPGGIVVFDDYRAQHAPGVAAAVWPALHHGLLPILLTPSKLYATWDDAGDWPAKARSWVASGGLRSEEQQIAGRDILRVWPTTPRALEWIPPTLVPAARKAMVRAQSVARRLSNGVNKP